MMIQAHLAEIERRHHALEKQIAEAMKHNSVDDLELVELKRPARAFLAEYDPDELVVLSNDAPRLGDADSKAT
jgi:hypothetical protein